MNFSNGVIETLQTMAGVKSTFEKGFVQKDWKATGEISVFLDLQSPPYTGQIRFHFSRNVLAQLYNKMMGQEVSADSPELIDCLGEISNVCYGYAKGKLNEKGYALQMTLPHPGKTADLPAVVSHHPQIIIPFKVFDEVCQIQIVIF